MPSLDQAGRYPPILARTTGPQPKQKVTNNPMNTSMHISSGSINAGSIVRKRYLRGSSAIYVCGVLALACVLAPEYSSGQASSDLCPKNTVEPPSGLVAWWPLGEKSGNQVIDRSGHDNHGIPKPGKIGSTAPLGPVSASGFVGDGLRFFNGSYVRITNSDSHDSLLDFDDETGFTIDAWVKAGNGPIVGNFNPSTKRGYALYITNNQLTFDIGRGNSPILSWKKPIVPNTWNFIAVVVKRGSNTPKKHSVTLYSGTVGLSASGPKALPVDAKSYSGLAVDIGKCAGSQAGCTTVIDELEMFNRPLLLADLQKIFNAKHYGKCIKPVGIKKN